MPLQTKQSSPSLADNALRLPTEFPAFNAELPDRFPSLERWQKEVRSFFQEYESGIRDFAAAVQDTNELGGLLIADPQTGAVYIHPSRGAGEFADAATPFFINREGYFSLGSNLTWNPVEKVLTIEGEIIVDSGTINGALVIGPGGSFSGGQTAFNTGTGFWLGYDAGDYKFSVGSPTNNFIWTGSTLAITGLLTTTGSIRSSATVGPVLETAGATTNARYCVLENDGNQVLWGTESSTGNSLGYGLSAYSGFFAVGNVDFSILVNGTVRGIISSAGLAITGVSTASSDIETTGNSSKGFILKSPDATRWRIAVSNAGVLSAAAA